MSLTQKLSELSIVLPPVAGPFGAYVPVKRAAGLLFVAGTLPMLDGNLMATGPVPSRTSPEAARLAARQCVVNALGAVRAVHGTLDDVVGVVRVGCFVASDPTFTGQPGVANGASELLLELFGEAGKHVRAAVGTNVLPLDATVEVEFIFELQG